jgi:chaperonin cofactor prefoldin
MSERERRVRYRLEPLARLRTAEGDALKAELEHAADEVGRKERERDYVARGIERAEEDLRALRRGGALLSVDAQLRVQSELRQQLERRPARQRELDEAARSFEVKLGELRLKLQDSRALENHRGRQRRAFDEAQLRAALNAADERWLGRKR